MQRTKLCRNPNCTKDKLPQPIREFYSDSSRADGLAAWCKTCCKIKQAKVYDKDASHIRNQNTYYNDIIGHRERAKKYNKANPIKGREHQWRGNGIKNADGSWFKWTDYEELLALQHYKCGICKTKTPGYRTWHVDHSHITGLVRGILCGHCNMMLGHARDKKITLKNALKYLEDKDLKGKYLNG